MIQIRMDRTMEQVLVVETQLLRQYIAGKCGLIRENTEAALACIRRHHIFLPRERAEQDTNYKQIIPYVLVRRGDAVFSTRRLRQSGEARLHGKISLGIGGHINAFDEDADGDVLERGLRRELEEEISMSQPVRQMRFLGLMNDDSNAVGKVHLGVCFLLETDGEVCVRETEKLEGRWLAIAALPQLAPEMETWSSLVLDVLAEKE